jgi:hypothetical protein
VAASDNFPVWFHSSERRPSFTTTNRRASP